MTGKAHSYCTTARGALSRYSAVAAAVCVMSWNAVAGAGLLLDVETRVAYEDNVAAHLSDSGGGGTGNGPLQGGMSMAPGAGPGPGSGSGSGSLTSSSTGDASTLVSVEAGAHGNIGERSSLFVSAFSERTDYSRYPELDSRIAGLRAGFGYGFTDALSARVTAFGKKKDFADPLQDGSSFGGALSFKQKAGPLLWFKAQIEYENNSADSALFSYEGYSYGLRIGYALLDSVTVAAGLSRLVREYEEPAGVQGVTDGASAGIEWAFARSWSVDGAVDRQSSAYAGGPEATNMIFSGGIRYSY